MRYSSEPGDPALDDRIPQPRGCGIKIFNVHGEFLPAGEGFDTQDLEFNSTPALDLADAKTSREIIDLRIKYGGNRRELYKHLEARKDVALQKARDQVRNTHLEVLQASIPRSMFDNSQIIVHQAVFTNRLPLRGLCSQILPGPVVRNAAEAVRGDRQARLAPRPYPERLAARIP